MNCLSSLVVIWVDHNFIIFFSIIFIVLGALLVSYNIKNGKIFWGLRPLVPARGSAHGLRWDYDPRPLLFEAPPLTTQGALPLNPTWTARGYGSRPHGPHTSELTPFQFWLPPKNNSYRYVTSSAPESAKDSNLYSQANSHKIEIIQFPHTFFGT